VPDSGPLAPGHQGLRRAVPKELMDSCAHKDDLIPELRQVWETMFKPPVLEEMFGKGAATDEISWLDLRRYLRAG